MCVFQTKYKGGWELKSSECQVGSISIFLRNYGINHAKIGVKLKIFNSTFHSDDKKVSTSQ